MAIHFLQRCVCRGSLDSFIPGDSGSRRSREEVLRAVAVAPVMSPVQLLSGGCVILGHGDNIMPWSRGLRDEQVDGVREACAAQCSVGDRQVFRVVCTRWTRRASSTGQGLRTTPYRVSIHPSEHLSSCYAPVKPLLWPSLF